jgi:uncharacterized membrane protein
MSAFIILPSAALALIRLSGHKSQAYQAVAHLWVGGLCGAWWIERTPMLLHAIVVLSIVEVMCFFVFHPRPSTTERRYQ